MTPPGWDASPKNAILSSLFQVFLQTIHVVYACLLSHEHCVIRSQVQKDHKVSGEDSQIFTFKCYLKDLLK